MLTMPILKTVVKATRKRTVTALRVEMERLGVSQADVARALGLTLGTVSNWVNGHRNPTLGNLQRVVDILRKRDPEVSIDKLLKRAA